ncbi:hypothetical protein M413DRAFT_134628 [Hebeloma cylindrosporum]|uniref:Uncharacterized protein n=1 Tax=Hebeloma cylindrosporum TaxID=76867 RepID=A0A0C3C0P9_HEBCY|nr:hypothetical protein M413DRAFT_134628 [Hebeloma cylindrosporum h7]
MAVPCRRCSKEVLRPERCVVLDGKPCAACTEDIELENEIKDLENLIEKIHMKRRALRTIMNTNHDLIHKFPPEIASQIFVQCAPSSTSLEMTSPLMFGAVCQGWRRLAWATPELWSTLVIGFGSAKSKDYSHLPQLIAECLDRSASLPLTLTVVAEQPWFPGDDLYHELSTILNKHSARWFDVHFGLPGPHLHRLCGSSQPSMVRRLALVPPTRSIQSHTSSLSPAFSMRHKPSPTYLKLTTFRLMSVDILWNNLTGAVLRDMGVDECIELIRRSPLLEHLDLLWIKASSGIFPIPDTRISCSHLRSLGLSDIKRESRIEQFLDSVRFPSLERLVYGECALPLDSVRQFIENSSSCLKTFTIIGDIYAPVHGLVLPLSSLEVLEMRFRFRTGRPETNSEEDELLALLCSPDEPLPFFPHLHTLIFGGIFPFPWDSISRIFASRRPLKVTIDYNSRSYQHMTAGDADQLSILVDKGFDLTVIEDGKVVIPR